MFRIAHISDLHIPPLPPIPPARLLGKRLLGLVSWHYKWKAEHRIEILDALRAQLDDLAPDHICVTGDLTFTTDRTEVDQAAEWLESLGDPRRVSLVPGNHDAYVAGALDYACERWAQWMLDDRDGRQRFPYLHRRGPADIIGLSSAIAVRTPRTFGRIGPAQLQRTRALLEQLEGPGRVRIVLLHHPPQDGAARPGKELLDRGSLQSVLAESSVDLVLHGHLHRPVRARLDGAFGPIAVLGAASVSARGVRYSPAQFHLLEIDDSAPEIGVHVRNAQYEATASGFVLGERESLHPLPA